MEHPEYSQGYEFTQPVFEEGTAPEEEDPEEEAAEAQQPAFWGRLTALSGGERAAPLPPLPAGGSLSPPFFSRQVPRARDAVSRDER